LYPIIEYENGELTRVRKIKNRKPVEEYLKIQRRFRHLFRHPRGKEVIQMLQKVANENAARFKLDV
jgi:pyruvate ferredoxin oxidoreductase beta subunit